MEEAEGGIGGGGGGGGGIPPEMPLEGGGAPDDDDGPGRRQIKIKSWGGKKVAYTYSREHNKRKKKRKQNALIQSQHTSVNYNR